MSGAFKAGLCTFSVLAIDAASIYMRGRSAEPPPPAAEGVSLGPLPGEPSFTERSGRKVSLSDLRGNPWIAGFVFTRCGGPCPRVMAALASLAEGLSGTPLKTVVFTVDPDHDTPGVLAEYAGKFRLGKGTWLLTGERELLYGLIRDGFKLGVAPAEGPGAQDHPITHSQRLVLVDGGGMIRGYYDALDPKSVRRLDAAARGLLR